MRVVTRKTSSITRTAIKPRKKATDSLYQSVSGVTWKFAKDRLGVGPR